MQLRRCAMLFIELSEPPQFSLRSLLSGGDGLERSVRWLAHAPHLCKPCAVTLSELTVLQSLASGDVCERSELERQHGEAAVRSLLDAGLLLPVEEPGSTPAIVDATLRTVAWWPPAALAQRHGGWSDIDVAAFDAAGLFKSAREVLEEFGPPPAHDYHRRPGASVVTLAAPERSDFDDLLSQRTTCRNFDSDASLSTRDLSTMLYRVWAALGSVEVAPGVAAVKKSSPSGGGLHASEAYVLVQRADGLQPGIYHYLSLHHALEPLHSMSFEEAARLAYRCVAGQSWFANAPVLVIMTSRFDRLYWKYPRHSKAWRVAHLDIGHLSQTMYLSAVDLGLGAFVTAAINDRDIDLELGLESMRESSIAVVGFGPRSQETINDELDNLTATPASLR